MDGTENWPVAFAFGQAGGHGRIDETTGDDIGEISGIKSKTAFFFQLFPLLRRYGGDKTANKIRRGGKPDHPFDAFGTLDGGKQRKPPAH